MDPAEAFCASVCLYARDYPLGLIMVLRIRIMPCVNSHYTHEDYVQLKTLSPQ